MKKFHISSRRLAAIIIGLVFFVAGLLKLTDPVGSGLIVEEYFKFFHLPFLKAISLPVAIFLALLETMTGAALITGVYRKIAAIAASVFIVIFTVITFFLWIFNPSMDCGCFGEAIHLTHFQTFIKNIILLAMSIFAFFPFKDFGEGKTRKLVTFWVVSLSALALAIYSVMYIPLIEFTPFNLSSMLAASRGEMPEHNVVTTFVYEKNGQQGSFTIDNLPDSTWTFVKTEELKKDDLIKESDFPQLSFRDASGKYCDELAADSSVIVISVYKPSELKGEDWKNIGETLAASASTGFVPILILASEVGSADSLIPVEGLTTQERMQILMSTYYADYKTLISLNRSNGGATYFNNGNLIRKWAKRNLPKEQGLGKIFRNESIDTMISASTKGRLTFQAFCLYSFVLLFLI